MVNDIFDFEVEDDWGDDVVYMECYLIKDFGPIKKGSFYPQIKLSKVTGTLDFIELDREGVISANTVVKFKLVPL